MKKIALTLGTGTTANVLNNGYTGGTFTLRQLPGTTNFEFVQGEFQVLTYSGITDLINNNSLQPGAFYMITDADSTLYSGGTNIIVEALSNNQLGLEAEGIFYTPKYDQSVEGFGIWTPSATTAELTTSPGTPINFNILDTTFNFGDKFDSYVYAIAVQNDGKILVGGEFTSYDGYSRDYIVRLESDGSIDTTFSSDTKLSSGGYVYDIAIQSDGKIIAVGNMTTYDGNSSNYIVRINSDGTFDDTFNSGGTKFDTGSVNAVKIQSDGKIIVGGNFNSYDGNTSNYIVRLNSDGTYDGTFSADSKCNNYIDDVAIQSDGKIIAVGAMTAYDTNSSNYIVRINSDGTFDDTFNSGGTKFNTLTYAVEIQSDGKIVVGGSHQTYDSNNCYYIARLNSDGTFDSTFNSGTKANNLIYKLDIQSDGKIVVGGQLTAYDSITTGYIARINSDGSLDTTFDSDPGFNNYVRVVKCLDNGKILVGGDFTDYDGITTTYFTSLESNGKFDKNFGDTELNDEVNVVKVEASQQILLGGTFTDFDGVPNYYLVRLASDGRYDSSLITGLGFDGEVNAIDVDGSANIYVGGEFENYDVNSANKIVKIGSTGTYDGTFGAGVGTGFNSTVKAVTVNNPAGRLYVGGSFSQYAGNLSNGIVGISLANGAYDGSFIVGTGFSGNVNCITMDASNNLIVGGSFDQYNGTLSNNIIRIQSNGSVDTTFSAGTGFNGEVKTIKIQPSDNKILVGGDFTSYSGIPCNRIARLETNGDFDFTFDSGEGFDNTVMSIDVQSDDKILVGGLFNSYDVFAKNHIIRLNTNGSLDNTYGVITGFHGGSSKVNSLNIQSDGNCVVGGIFDFFNENDYYYNNVARLNAHGGTITQSSTSATGTGYTVNVKIIDGVVTVNYVVDYGYGYQTGDTITIDGTTIGGSSGTDDVVFSATSVISYVSGNTTIWGGYVWENVNGYLGSKIDIFNLDSEWNFIPYNSTDYNVSVDSVLYDFANDKIIYRRDKNANEVSASYDNIQYFINTRSLYNPIKSFQWGNGYNTTTGIGVGENKVVDSLFENINFRGKSVLTNTLTQRSSIFNNSFEGGSYINNNTLNEQSEISSNILNKNSFIKSNLLDQGSKLNSNNLNDTNSVSFNDLNGESELSFNTLDGSSYITENTLSKADVKSNTLHLTSLIDSNTLNKGSMIKFTILDDASSLLSNTLEKNSSFLYNYLTNTSSIEENKLSFSNFDFSFVGSLSNKVVSQIESKNSDVTSNISLATDIYGDTTKTIFKNLAGVVRLSYYDEYDTNTFTDVNN